MKKILIALALSGLVATNAQARGGWHGHHGHGGFFWGAAVGAALTLPFYYSRAWADPWPYYYYAPGPTVYVNPPLYVQSQPTYVQSQPLYVQNSSYATTPSQPAYAGGTAPSSGVIELGPATGAPPANTGVTPLPAPNGPTSVGQLYVYPSRGQSEQQAANDRYDCSRWATEQSGYDPDLRVHRNPQTGPENYARALSACLEGRGYTVR